MTARTVLSLLLSMPKTVAFNFTALPLRQAIRLPVLINWRTRIVACHRGALQLVGPCRTARVRIGFPHLTYPGRVSSLKLTGRVIFMGDASMLAGVDLNVGGELSLGAGLRCNAGVKIDCRSNSSIGDDVVIGPECFFTDDDGHRILDRDGMVTNEGAGFKIGNHVWYGRSCMTLKGVEIAPDTVVGAGSVLTRDVLESNVVIAGNPARVAKRGIDWRA